MDRFYALSHAPIPFHFRQNARDFVVDEIPLYEWSGEGEHLVFQLRKKNLSTFEVIDILCHQLGLKGRDIGYAGLKDKHAMTKQYFSILKKYEDKLDALKHENIKIISKHYHNNKLRTGHLKGNRFFVRVKKVTPTAAKKISEALKLIKKNGMPNFFGYQRFGNDADNHKKGEQILAGTLKERSPKLKKLFINAFQSHQFNLWLSRRLEINTLVDSFEPEVLVDMLDMPVHEIEKLKAQKHPFKIVDGDTMMHYPHGRLFTYEGDAEDLERYESKKIVPSGLLCGKRAHRSVSYAHNIEKAFDIDCSVDGARRYAWVYPEEVEGEYKENEAWFEFHFTLPKGCYATVLIEEIAKREIKE